jgi:hypothetical protein
LRLDIRLPLGLLFLIFGSLLLIFGLASNPEIYARSLGININFWWGIVMLLFGLALLGLAYRSHRHLAHAASIAKAKIMEHE